MHPQVAFPSLGRHMLTGYSLTGAIMLKTIYGYSIEQEKDDDLIILVEKMMTNLSLAFIPLAWMVDIIPGLRYLPSSLPWMNFKKTAREFSRITHQVVEAPFLFTQRQMAGLTARPSYVARLLEESRDKGEERSDEETEAIKITAAGLFGGGMDTTASNLSSFVLSMACFPEVQRKAQQEIDDVVGPDRLPCFDDRDKMPYMEGVIMEALRCLPNGPMGFTHTATEAMTYGGYDIPKGAHLMPAVWWLAHDPQVYRDPDEFDPERYSWPRNEPDPRPLVFGFGRRVCPGQWLADSTLFLVLSQILAVFSIRKAIDEKGSEIDIKLEGRPGMVTHPVNCPFQIRPRNAQKAHLLQRLQDENPWEGSDAESMREILSMSA